MMLRGARWAATTIWGWQSVFNLRAFRSFQAKEGECGSVKFLNRCGQAK